MYKPSNVDEYMELISQTIFEIHDLILCAEDEGDGDMEFSTMMPDLRKIEAGLHALQAEIEAGNYAVGRGQDLPFMTVVQKVRQRLPIAILVDGINITHKKGFARD